MANGTKEDQNQGVYDAFNKNKKSRFKKKKIN